MDYTVTCKHCNRFLFKAVGTTIIESLPCPNSSCRAKLNIKIVNTTSTPEQLNYKFKTSETPPKEKKQ